MEARPPGRIITFYSFKGGTGRSLALATTAWILAANGKRVLMLDWDLEAPGLHRYFKPFLIDKGIASSEGMIEFVSAFADAMVGPLGEGETLPADWYVEHADLEPYVLSIDYQGFPAGGKIDLVPAGRQGQTYAIRVNSFNWKDFYDRLGGGAFLEAVKAKLRERYDYVLIDSRTGVSDTAGTCTIQMPDVLAVCFTYNNQSIEGAAAVARSAEQERKTIKELKERRRARGSGSSSGTQHEDRSEDDLLIFPVPTRVDQSEQEKLRLRQDYAHEVFDGFLHLDRPTSSYWLDVEVPYLPFMAYEEVLPVFTDDPRDGKKPLAAMIRLTGYLTGLPLSELGLEIEDKSKQEILREFAATPSAAREKPKSNSPVSMPQAKEKRLGTEAALAETEEFVRWRRELQPLVKTWSASPGNRRTLLRGSPLSAAKRWVQVAGPTLTESEKTYIQESSANERLRLGVIFALVTLAVFVLLAVSAFLQLRAREDVARKETLAVLAVGDTENGKRAAESRDYEKALGAFTLAIERFKQVGEGPSAAEAYVGRALVYVKKGNYEAAGQDLSHAIVLNPGNAAAYMARGNMERDKGATKAALADYERALQKKPGDAEVYLNRGLAYAKAQPPDPVTAVADYQQAVRAKPDFAEAYYYLGVAYAAGNGGLRIDREQAISFLEKAVDLAKDDPAISVAAAESLGQLRGVPGPQATAPAALPRVFMMYTDRLDAPVLDTVAERLSGDRFNVQGKELVGESTTKGDIRYYYTSDEQNAGAAKNSVEKILETKGYSIRLKTLYLGGRFKSVAPGTIEVWLPSLATSSPELRAIAEGIAALQLPRTQQGLQSQIVQELRKAPLDRSPAAIADDVASFGIGPGQPQAPAWKSLIARLRGLAR